MVSKKCIIVTDSTTLGGVFESHGYETVIFSDGVSVMLILDTVQCDIFVIDSASTNGYNLLELMLHSKNLSHKVTFRGPKKEEGLGINALVLYVDASTSDDAWIDLIENNTSLVDSSQQKINKDKILVVDDVEELLEMYEMMFQLKGYDVQTAKNGLDGITKAASFKPKYILLDIMMPHMDGFELMKAFYNNTSLESIIVVNSNIDGSGVIERIYASGADYYIRKSDFVPTQIIYMIEKGLFDHKRDRNIPIENISFNPGKDFFNQITAK